MADRSLTDGRELRLSGEPRLPSAPVQVGINTRSPRTAQLALAGQEAARGAGGPKPCGPVPAGTEGVCGWLADGHRYP